MERAQEGLRAQFLQADERVRLIRVVAGIYDFTDSGVRGRRVFLQEVAGLGALVPHLNLDGAPAQAAGDVVGKLERYGRLKDRDAYHALGALLCAMLGTGELDETNAAFVATLVVRYSLVSDEAFLESIRSEYEVSEAPGSSPGAPPARRVVPTEAVGAPQPDFAARIADDDGLERIINSADNFLDIHLARGTVYCSAAVGQVHLPMGKAVGTAFLIGPDLVMTNAHVVGSSAVLDEVTLRFGYVNDRSGVAQPGQLYEAVPGFYHSSPARELDYAIFRLAGRPLADLAPGDGDESADMNELAAKGRHLGYLRLTPRQPLADTRVNVLQHPGEQPLKVVLTQNYVVHVTEQRVQYVADTMEGSSGSPVFNDQWQVIALHHSGKPYPPESIDGAAKKIWKGKFRVNEGIPMRAILKDFEEKGLMRYLPK